MTEQRPITRIDRQDSAAIVRFRTERINDFTLLRQTERELHALFSLEDCGVLVFDFSGLEYVVSEFFGMLIRLNHEADRRGIQVRACQLGRFFQEIYEIMHFGQIIPTYDTVADALSDQS